MLLRILLIGYLYGITSERKLVEELRMHLAWRWFTGLGFDQEIPHHSTFSKNRHGRFQESKLFEQLVEEIVARCLEAGLVEGDNLSVDGSFVEANANNGSRIPGEQLTEVARVKHNVRQYLAELEHQAITLLVKSGLFRGHLKHPDLAHLGAKVVAQSCHYAILSHRSRLALVRPVRNRFALLPEISSNGALRD